MYQQQKTTRKRIYFVQFIHTFTLNLTIAYAGDDDGDDETTDISNLGLHLIWHSI